MGKAKQLEPVETYLDPLKFYNHGDNPALKNFMRIAMENSREGKIIDHRTLILDKGQKFFLARNWDDFLQRDLQATTFPRSFFVLIMNTMLSVAAYKWSKRLLPIGKFGIRKVSQTSLYHNFGPVGVVGVGALMSLAIFSEYKTMKFTFHKFYQHVLMGERNYFMEQKNFTSQYANYAFSDNILSQDEEFGKSDALKHLQAVESPWTPTYQGAYGKTQ